MIIGLTGGIGSGKSTVAALLAARGAIVIDTDVIAREIVEPGSPVLGEIHQAFGSHLIKPDGTLDRDALARIVFSDAAKREQLNRLTHPAIRRRTLERVREQPKDKTVVVVVPLLFESEFDKECDAVISVVAAPDLRRARVAARDRTSEAHVEARMRAQLPDGEYERRARYVIRNDGELAHLERAVDEVWNEIGRA